MQFLPEIVPRSKGGEYMQEAEKKQAKSAWSKPELTIHGTVEQLTATPKMKDFGFKDDFGVVGVS